MKFSITIAIAAVAVLVVGTSCTDAALINLDANARISASASKSKASTKQSKPVPASSPNPASAPAPKPAPSSASTPAPAPKAPASPAPAPGNQSMHMEMLCEVNRIRASHKLSLLSMDNGINQVSEQHSRLQASQNRMTHQFPGEPTPGQRIDKVGNWDKTAENVAYGYATVKTTMDEWMSSPGHRANILIPGLTHFGMGMVRSSNGTPYWTQGFGKDDSKAKNIPKC
ncbi:CAP domain-containing protein [Syncephalis plumigaleata]|nr:CAP domain-containing protein [Syncephalis plumigaleata]